MKFKDKECAENNNTLNTKAGSNDSANDFFKKKSKTFYDKFEAEFFTLFFPYLYDIKEK